MRFSMATPFPTVLVLLHLLQAMFAQATSALTLSTFQPINGFSDACTKAYNTALTDCSNADFSGQGCSAKCIGFLDNLTNLLTTTCVGTSAYPNTLIGIFLSGNGARTLCSNAGGSSSSSSGGDGYGQGGGQSEALPVQSAGRELSAAITSTSTSTSSTTSSTPQAAATSSTTTVVATTITPESTTTSVAIVGITVAPESTSDASTSTSHSKSSTSSSSTSTSTGNGNGGGTLLDIGSSACRDATVSVWLVALFAGLAGVTWLL